MAKNSPANAEDIRDAGSIPGLARSLGGCMATHSSILVWKIPWTEDPGGLQSMGSKRVRYTERLTQQQSFMPQLQLLICCFVQLPSGVQLSVTPWTVARQASLSFIISLSLLKLVSIESVMPSNHLIFCQPFSSCLQSFPASQFFASGGQSTGVSASASVLPMNIGKIGLVNL